MIKFCFYFYNKVIRFASDAQRTTARMMTAMRPKKPPIKASGTKILIRSVQQSPLFYQFSAPKSQVDS